VSEHETETVEDTETVKIVETATASGDDGTAAGEIRGTLKKISAQLAGLEARVDGLDKWRTSSGW
jgi:hypothetical protein